MCVGIDLCSFLNLRRRPAQDRKSILSNDTVRCTCACVRVLRSPVEVASVVFKCFFLTVVSSLLSYCQKMAPPNLTKKILEDFIEIYRINPCLWQIKNKDYHNRDKKEAAYKLLVEKLREIEPDASKDVVVKKINNLRSNVRKEKKKYEQSLKSGASADDVYRIKLWYYDLFNFIHDQCQLREISM